MDTIQSFTYIRDLTLSDENADSSNWEWRAQCKDLWEPDDEPWQKFREKWYGNTAPLVDLETPSLSLEPFGQKVDRSLSSSLFIRDSYLTLFNTVWKQAMKKRGTNGVIITGQPGTGKTLFNFYLLVRLLQLRQIVLYTSDGQRAHLFLPDMVYALKMEDLVSQGKMNTPLPCPKFSSKRVFIWSLFDFHERKEPSSVLLDYPCFPVQTTSPDPIRYRTWQKELSPLRTSLPLWTRNELFQGLRYQDKYQLLLDAISIFYANPSSNTTDPLEGFDGTRALLEDHYGRDDISPPSPEDAVAYLLDAAIHRFGYSARDVFAAVFNFAWHCQR